MKKVKQLNGYIIKEKREDEIPLQCSLLRKYAVFKNGIFLEDNLLWEEAIEFCEEN